MTTPAHAIASYLAAQMPELVPGTVLRVGDEVSPPAPGRSAVGVWVANAPGREALAFLDGGHRRSEQTPGIVVRIRGDKEDVPAAEMLATRIRDVLEMSRPPPFFDLRAQGSGIMRLGPNFDAFPFYAINFIARHDAAYRPLFAAPLAAPPVTQSDLLALPSTPSTTRNGFFTFTASAGQIFVFASPQAYGIPSAMTGISGGSAFPMTYSGTINLVGVFPDATTLAYDAYASGVLAAGTYTVRIS